MLKPSSRHVTIWSRNASAAGAHAPPAFTRAGRPTREVAQPALALQDRVRRPRGWRGGRSAGMATAARDVLLQVVAAVRVRRQASRRNRASAASAAVVPPRSAVGATRVIDRQRRAGRRRSISRSRSARGPAPEHLRAARSPVRRGARPANGFGRWTLADVRGERALQEPAERVRRHEWARGHAYGQQTIRVNLLEPHLHLSGRRRHHPGQHEGRVIIGDDHGSVGGKRRQQPSAGPGRRLDVREVGDAMAREAGPRCRPCRRSRSGADDHWPSGSRRELARTRGAACRARRAHAAARSRAKFQLTRRWAIIQYRTKRPSAEGGRSTSSVVRFGENCVTIELRRTETEAVPQCCLGAAAVV